MKRFMKLILGDIILTIGFLLVASLVYFWIFEPSILQDIADSIPPISSVK